MTMKAFIPLTKIDATRREVWGTFVEEAVDKYGEIMDYGLSKPRIEAWSNEIHKISGGESYGNVREMHQNNAAGKLIAIQYDDDAKKITVGAKIVDDAAWEKVLERVYNGFSIGGDYGKKWHDPVTKALRYEAIPAEATLADNPAMYGATFDMIKADGTHELQKFTKEPPMPETPTADATLSTDKPVRKFALPERLAKNAAAPRIEKTAVRAALQKCWDQYGYPVAVMPPVSQAREDAFDVSDAAYALMSLVVIAANEMDEAVKDPAEKADAQLMIDAAKTVLEFINGEMDELIANAPDALAMATRTGTLAKAGARNSKNDLAMIQEMHDNAVALGATCDQGDGGGETVDKTTEAGDLQKAATAELQKTFDEKLTEVRTALEAAHAAELAKVTGANDELRKEMNDLKAQVQKFASSPDPRLPVLKVAGTRENNGNDIPAMEKTQAVALLEKMAQDPSLSPVQKAEIGRLLANASAQEVIHAGKQKIAG